MIKILNFTYNSYLGVRGFILSLIFDYGLIIFGWESVNNILIAKLSLKFMFNTPHLYDGLIFKIKSPIILVVFWILKWLLDLKYLFINFISKAFPFELHVFIIASI